MHRARMIAVVLSLGAWPGCGPLAGLDAMDSPTSATGSGPGTAGNATTSSESTGPENTDADFIVPPDGGGPDLECDPC